MRQKTYRYNPHAIEWIENMLKKLVESLAKRKRISFEEASKIFKIADVKVNHGEDALIVWCEV
ncbi:MAG: hypothetical protein Q6363_002105 [Candidatus Njordarchaeota archaeon]